MEIKGLTKIEAEEKLKTSGYNTVPIEKTPIIKVIAKNFYGVIPIMLEFVIIFEFIIKNYLDSSIILVLLLFNALISISQELKVANSLELIQEKLKKINICLRDGEWVSVDAKYLVPDDIVKFSQGDLFTVDGIIIEGNASVDESSLTGEFIEIDKVKDSEVFSGTILKRGEIIVKVSHTGLNTKFGNTANLIRNAHAESQLEKIILKLAKIFLVIDSIGILAVIIFSIFIKVNSFELFSFVVILFISSIPVALPMVFSLAQQKGAFELSKEGVLVKDLQSVEEAAGIDVFCFDKTGTLTKGIMNVSIIESLDKSKYSDEFILSLALIASDKDSTDQIDSAIGKYALDRNIHINEKAVITEFLPFNPETRIEKSMFYWIDEGGQDNDGQNNRIIHTVLKGALTNVGSEDKIEFSDKEFEGLRILAVSYDGTVVGIIGLSDEIREDSIELIERIYDLNANILMITGDNVYTAKAIAKSLHLEGEVIVADDLKKLKSIDAHKVSVIAQTYPEDKIDIIRLLQKNNHIVGMTGDGVNDAPALKQADVGIAVFNATDIAKASSNIIFTKEGLANVISLIIVSRRIFERMLTYTLNMSIKKITIPLFLTIMFIFTSNMVLSARLLVLLIFANDFLTMSLVTDSVSYSKKLDEWNVYDLMKKTVILGSVVLIFNIVVFTFFYYILRIGLNESSTALYLWLVFSTQIGVYVIRARKNVDFRLPSRSLMFFSVAVVIVVTFFALFGILMSSINIYSIFILFVFSILLYIFLGLARDNIWHA